MIPKSHSFTLSTFITHTRNIHHDTQSEFIDLIIEMAVSPELKPQIQTQSLEDRVAIITGSSRGIGREIALHLASLGARVVINYATNSSHAESVAAQINSSSGGPNPRAIVVKADVSEPTQVKSLFDEAEKAFNSQVHILVNSAAVIDSKYHTLMDTSLEDFDRIFRYYFFFTQVIHGSKQGSNFVP